MIFLKQKIFRSICLVSALVLIASLIGAIPITLNYCTDALKKELKLEASYLAYGVEQEGVAYIENTENTNRITLISPDGSVLFDSFADTSSMDNHLDRDEILTAIKNGESYTVRRSSTLGSRTVYYAMVLSDGSVLRVASGVISPLSLLSGLTPIALIIFVLALLFALLVAFRLSRGIVRSLEKLDLEHPVDTPPFPELAPMLTKLSEQNTLISRQMDELRMRQSELEAITHNMADGLILLDSRARILSCNKSALGILGTHPKPEELSGKPSILQLELGGGIRKLLRSAFLGNRDEQMIQYYEKIYRVITDPVMNDGAVAGVAILVLDETEKENREELRREFTSNISHELKTPLTSISGFAELIRAGLSGENTEHFADNIYKEAQRLITLVNDIIKLSRLDGRSPELEFKRVSLLSAAEGVVNRLKNVAEQRNISITLTGSDEEITASPGLLDEIIYNLCDNAVKYGRDGGFVRVTVTPPAKEGEGASITVEDNGIGIPADQLDRVFERFYRVDKSHSKSIGGTGLGLSIVKHGVACHKAELSVDSTLNEGTRIRIVFPTEFAFNTDLTQNKQHI